MDSAASPSDARVRAPRRAGVILDTGQRHLIRRTSLLLRIFACRRPPDPPHQTSTFRLSSGVSQEVPIARVQCGESWAFCVPCVLFVSRHAGKGSHQAVGALVTKSTCRYENAVADLSHHHMNKEYHKGAVAIAEDLDGSARSLNHCMPRIKKPHRCCPRCCSRSPKVSSPS